MSISPYKSDAPLELLYSEAASLLDEARQYRAEMDKLPENDPGRKIYERIIRNLLDRSRRLSESVSSTASSS